MTAFVTWLAVIAVSWALSMWRDIRGDDDPTTHWTLGAIGGTVAGVLAMILWR